MTTIDPMVVYAVLFGHVAEYVWVLYAVIAALAALGAVWLGEHSEPWLGEHSKPWHGERSETKV